MLPAHGMEHREGGSTHMAARVKGCGSPTSSPFSPGSPGGPLGPSLPCRRETWLSRGTWGHLPGTAGDTHRPPSCANGPHHPLVASRTLQRERGVIPPIPAPSEGPHLGVPPVSHQHLPSRLWVLPSLDTPAGPAAPEEGSRATELGDRPGSARGEGRGVPTIKAKADTANQPLLPPPSVQLLIPAGPFPAVGSITATAPDGHCFPHRGLLPLPAPVGLSPVIALHLQSVR